MPRRQNTVVVLVTAPSQAVARRLAAAVLEARLAACATLIPGAESHYWWEGVRTHSREVLMVLKTRTALVRQLQAMILDLHPYDTPEFLTLAVHSGSPRYLAWILDSTTPPRAPRGRRTRPEPV
jgi:periplasmic divalent cation tolerance protein